MGTIYGIQNRVSKRTYIGLTRKDDPTRRKLSHLERLRNNRHKNKLLQRDWNRQGMEEFDFIIVEANVPLDSLAKREDFWIDNFHEQPGGVYNVAGIEENQRLQRRLKKKKRTLRGLKKIDFERPAWHSWVYGGEQNPRR